MYPIILDFSGTEITINSESELSNERSIVGWLVLAGIRKFPALNDLHKVGISEDGTRISYYQTPEKRENGIKTATTIYQYLVKYHAGFYMTDELTRISRAFAKKFNSKAW
jgi:hypothetical protein